VTRAKICGITRLEDAELAADLGAWAIGFILWSGSRRACDPALAAGIARRLRRRIQLVGVFVNPTLDEVTHAADQIGLTHLQLHGEEGPSFCTEAARRTGCRVIKAVRVRGAAELLDLERYRLVDLHLLDAWAEGERGGTGETWDWSLLTSRRRTVPTILSGGLTPENVGSAIAAVRPWAVDVASGVEARPGIKDPDKVRSFLDAVPGPGSDREDHRVPTPARGGDSPPADLSGPARAS
jgi:phosphoribosylanthranilate isomerase